MIKGLILSLMVVSVPAWAKKAKSGDSFPLTKVEKLEKFAGQKPDLKGKVVLVDFWASWCGPCKQALPAYDALYKKYGKNGFVVVGVNVDDEKEAGKGFLKEHPVSFGHLYDAEKSVVGELGVETMPTSFLIDKKGKIRLVHQGFREGDEEKMKKEIVGLLKAK